MPSVIRKASDLGPAVARWREAGERVGFVPTMGALHEGHFSLVRASLEECDRTVVSIFVNPLQFDRKDDLEAYPRTDEEDCRTLHALGVDLVYLPRADAIYPEGFSTTLTQVGIPDDLCGASRPGHFDGVLTVVLKLFNTVRPDRAFFGRKDYQQAASIRRMVRDLDVPVDIRVMPIVREADGLAMSSRNVRLKPEERAAAPAIHRALIEADRRFGAGTTSVADLRAAVTADLEAIPGARVDYAKICDPDSVAPRDETSDAAAGDLLAVAVWLGDVRLIDNLSFARGKDDA